MTIASGTRFGSYEVVESIGAGGMGEVFRARDSNLKRDVALKVLPQAFVADADRLARFRREAEILASLNHPNIAQVYGLEQIEDQTAIVMELVEGPTLGERLKDGPIPPDEAMGIALQILAALEAAHERQIVHRDLKPDNVKLRDDGTVKVLDFGIAKPIDASAISGGSPVMTTPAVTQTGVILGTAAYMSPEQARGKLVDQRTDIWAFGCLLFEMLTGQRAFGGEDVMLTLARVLDRATDLSSIPKTISPAVRHTIRLCLEKDPRRRIADVRDVRLALEGGFESELPTHDVASAGSPPAARTGTMALALVVGALITAAVAAVLWPEPAPRLVTRFEIPVPAGQSLRTPQFLSLGLSRDGRRIVYNATDGFYLRDLAVPEMVRIPGSEGNGEDSVYMPMFAPDGEAIEFAGQRPGTPPALQRIAVDGGPVTTLAGGDTWRFPNAVSLTRTPAGTWLVSHRGGISQVNSNTGEVRLVVDVGEDNHTSGARLMPDGDTVLFAIRADARGIQDLVDSRIVTASLSAGLTGEAELTTIVPSGFDPRYIAATGHLLFGRDQAVYAVAFDPATRTTRGEVRAVLPDVRLALANAATDYEVAENGTLAYLPGSGETASGARWAWVYADGRVEPVAALNVAGNDQLLIPRLSPDRSRLAIATLNSDNPDLWVYDLTRPGSRTLIAGDDAAEPKGVWTPDGRSLIFFREGVGLFRRAADASSREEPVLALPDGFFRLIPDWISPDGSELVMTAFKGTSANALTSGIYRLRLGGEAALEPVLDEPEFGEQSSELSPDGRYIAYATDESGSSEIHIRPYPDVTSRRIVVSTEGGLDPLWDPQGAYLYYAEGTGRSRLVRVPVDTSPELVLGEPERLSTEVIVSNIRPNYDYDPAADRWLVRTLEAASDSMAETSIVVVENWTEWLRNEVPVD